MLSIVLEVDTRTPMRCLDDHAGLDVVKKLPLPLLSTELMGPE